MSADVDEDTFVLAVRITDVSAEARIREARMELERVAGMVPILERSETLGTSIFEGEKFPVVEMRLRTTRTARALYRALLNEKLAHLPHDNHFWVPYDA